MGNNLPEGFYSDDDSMWVGHPDKNKANLIITPPKEEKGDTVEETFNSIMNCEGHDKLTDPIPVAAKYLGESAGFSKEKWMKLAIVHQDKEIKRLEEKIEELENALYELNEHM